MLQFTILYRRADHSDAVSLTIDAGDIDDAARRAVALADEQEYVAGVWQLDTPHELIAHHAKVQNEHYDGRSNLVHPTLDADAPYPTAADVMAREG